MKAAVPSESGRQRYSFIILSGSRLSAFSGISILSTVSRPTVSESSLTISDSVKLPFSNKNRGFLGSAQASNFEASSGESFFLNSAFAASIFFS